MILTCHCCCWFLTAKASSSLTRSDSCSSRVRDEQLAVLTLHHRPTYASFYTEVGTNLTTTTPLAQLNGSSPLGIKQWSRLQWRYERASFTMFYLNELTSFPPLPPAPISQCLCKDKNTPIHKMQMPRWGSFPLLEWQPHCPWRPTADWLNKATQTMSMFGSSLSPFNCRRFPMCLEMY